MTITLAEQEALKNLFPSGIVAFDVETTGLSPFSDMIIELAAVKLNSNGTTETFRELINPEVEIPPATTDIHHITDQMVENCETIGKVLPEFMSFIEGLPLLAHNAQFDIGFLVKDSHRVGVPLGERDIFDSCQMARSSFKNKPKAPENFKLSTLAEYFAIPLNHHKALDDSIACLRIFAQCLFEIKKETREHFVKERAKLFNTSSLQKMKERKLDSKFDLLVKKIPTQETVYITYRGGTHGDKPRPIRPIGIIPMPQGLVLYGECLLTKVHKTFIMRKINHVGLSKDKNES